MPTKLKSTGVEFPDSTTQTTEGVTSVTAGNALTGGGSGSSVTINHADTSSQGSVNNSGNTFIQDITLDTYGHITALTSTEAVGGATGGGSDKIFFENDQTVTTSYTVGPDVNAMTAGPITINNGVTVTVADGSRWVVL